MCHVSRVTCHVSHVTCHMSRFFFFFFFSFLFSDKVVKLIGGGSVINGGLPRLVINNILFFTIQTLHKGFYKLGEYCVQLLDLFNGGNYNFIFYCLGNWHWSLLSEGRRGLYKWLTETQLQKPLLERNLTRSGINLLFHFHSDAAPSFCQGTFYMDYLFFNWHIGQVK